MCRAHVFSAHHNNYVCTYKEMHDKYVNKISAVKEVLAVCTVWEWGAQRGAMSHQWSVQSLSSSENFLFQCCKATKNVLFYVVRMYLSAVSRVPQSLIINSLKQPRQEMYSQPAKFLKKDFWIS